MRATLTLLPILFVTINSFCQSREQQIFQRLSDKNLIGTAHYLNKAFDEKNDKRPFVSVIKNRGNLLPAPNQTIAYSYLGHDLIKQHRLEEGLTLMKQARQLAQHTGGFAAIVFNSKNAVVFKELGRLDSALYYERNNLQGARDLGIDSITTEVLLAIGSYYYDARQFQSTIDTYRKILLMPNTPTIIRRNAYHTIALSFRNLGIYDSALAYFDPVIANTDKTDTFYLGLTYGNIGDTYFLQEKYKQALPYLLTELDYTTRGGKVTDVSMDCMITLGHLYLATGDLSSAESLYRGLASNMRSLHEEPKVKQRFFKLSSELFQRKNDYQAAFSYLEKFHNIQDSLDNQKNIALLEQLAAQYDFDQQRREIDILNQRTLRQEAESRQKSWMLVGAGVTLVLITMLSIVLFLNYRQKQSALAMARKHGDYVETVNEELRANMERMEEKNTQIFSLAGKLQEANSAKDKLFTIISHDLRSPINALKGLLGLVTDEQITQEQFRSFSGSLKSGIEHVDFTLNNLLQWSKNQLQGMQTHPTVVDIAAVAGENVNFLNESVIRKKIVIDNVVKSANVWADREQLNLVIRNLTSNAIKFTPSGGKVSLGSYHDNGHVVFTVKDSGVGIGADDLTKLFDEHEHYTTSGTAGEKGSGLGLRLCQDMIRNNNGKIWAESEVDKGTTFFVSLPGLGSAL